MTQGSILGHLHVLFLLYLNQFSQPLLNITSTVNMYADDLALYRLVCSSHDMIELQDDFNHIADLITSLCLQLNLDLPALTAADGAPLERVSTYTYLGLHVCATLAWSTHILSIKTKTKRLLGMLFRGYYQHCPSDILLKLYLSTVRPHMEYASCIWHPHTQKHTKMLADVQKFALRISTKRWNLPYDELLGRANLTTLAYRRKRAGLCRIYQLVHQIVEFPPNFLVRSFPTQSKISGTIDHIISNYLCVVQSI